jgi:gamma-D-glutamyl-L-lysine dipeptidyl-peptidase
MSQSITVLSVVPVRAQASHKSEQVSQLLFGETCTVMEKSKEWRKIRCDFDGYEGWVLAAQIRELAAKELSAATQNIGIALDIASTANSSDNSVPIVIGSSLPQFDGINFKIGKEKFIYNGQSIQPDQQLHVSLIEKIALKYLNAPYHWGGRSPFGIDCSGLSQVVFKCVGIDLKRDAWQQAESGVVVDFVENSTIGDLAFFHNDEGKIIHVGIILKDNKIIHASGKVRIDTIDHYGIFNTETKKYSHQLKIVKRYF